MAPPDRPLAAPLLLIAAVAVGAACWLVSRGELSEDAPARVGAFGEPRLEADLTSRTVIDRSQQKMAIACALVRGELTPEEAADRFRELVNPTILAYLRDQYPTASDEELCYRHLVQYVATAGDREPGAPARARRLEGDVNRWFRPPAGAEPGSSPDAPGPRLPAAGG